MEVAGTMPAGGDPAPTPVAEPVGDAAVAAADGAAAAVPVEDGDAPDKIREKFTMANSDLVPAASAAAATADYPDALAVEWPEGDVLSCTAGPLYKIISEMGRTLANHESDIVMPKWLPDLRERVDRASRVEPRLNELLTVTSEVLKSLAESEKKHQLQEHLMKAENDEIEEIPLPINVKLKEQAFGLEKLEKRMALTPTVAELAQIRELIMDRCKQISVEVEQLQSDAEYRHEEKLDAHLSKFQEWEENVAAGVRSRFEVMDNKWEMAQDDLDVFRMKLDDTLTRITADVNAKTEAVKVRQDGADRRMNGVDVEIEKLRARASQLEDAAVPHLNARVDEVHKQLEDFEVVVAQDFEAVRRAAGEHDALLSAHRSELDAHMKEIVAHGAAIGRAEGRLVEHDGTLRQHLATLENHGERVEALEKHQEKTFKTIKDMKQQTDENQNQALGLINQTNGDVAKVRAACEKVQAQADETKAELPPLVERVDDEARKLADVAYVQHEHQGNLDTLNKQVGFVRSKVPQIDANTDAIAKLEGAVEIGEERADALQTHMKGVEGKALEAVDGLRTTRATAAQVRSFMDEGFDKSDKKVKALEKAKEKLEEQVEELEVNIEELRVKLAAKDKKPPIGEKMGTMLNAAQRREIYMTNVKAVATLCLAFETHILARKKLTPMNQSHGVQLGGTAMEVAEYLANCVNMEAITKVVLMKPDDTPLNNEDLSQMREDKVQTFIKDYHAEVAVHAKAESGLRYEARLYYLQKADEAIDMGMSKFDQVLVPASSLVSKLQVPTCVSCDRPLPGKRRAKDLYGTVAQQSFYGDMPEVQRVGEDGQPLNLLPAGDATPAEGLRVSGPIELRPRSGDVDGSMPPLPALKEQQRPATAPVKGVSANANAANHLYPIQRGSGPTSLGAPDVMFESAEGGGGGGGGGGGDYVKRGGFKLPASPHPAKLQPLIGNVRPLQPWKDVEDPKRAEEVGEQEFELSDSEEEGGEGE
jgi:chromosome segregation ATPase